MSDNITKLGYLAGATRFRRISEKLYVDGDKIYKDSGIAFKASWFSVFYILATTESPRTVLDLANEIGFSHITVKNVVRELEINGLVKIKPHPTDKRSKHISLSSKGKKLLDQLQKIWLPFAGALKHLLDTGHPDFLNIIDRIDKESSKNPINEKVKHLTDITEVKVVDYKPSLKRYFYELAGDAHMEVSNGSLEEEHKSALRNPGKTYLEAGGFLFFALLKNKVVGCVALKRLGENTFELDKLFVDPNVRKLGIASKLIERCITRCKENDATQLWLQTTMSMPETHKLYYNFGFSEKKAPKEMTVLKQTEKMMVLNLQG